MLLPFSNFRFPQRRSPIPPGAGPTPLSSRGLPRTAAVGLAALAAVALLAFSACGGGGSEDDPVGSQGPSGDAPEIAIDASPGGNSAVAIGKIDDCVSVESGDTFEIDVVIEGVQELLAWEVYLDFDPELVEVIDRDVKVFLAGNEGSNVIDVSQRLPSPPPYLLSAADISDPPTPDSGSGTLTRVTLRATAPGESTLEFPYVDVNEDGKVDLAPFLRNVAGDPIADEDGDTFFDGDATSARVSIGAPCDET